MQLALSVWQLLNYIITYVPHLKPSSVVIRMIECIAYVSVFWRVKPINLVN